MIEAVLFDWGGTLDDGRWSDELALRANEAALARIGRGDVGAANVSRWFQANQEMFRLESTDEVDLAEITEACLRELGCEPSADELEAYMEAWQRSVARESHLHPDALELLRQLRERGLRLGLVSNTFAPGRFLSPRLDECGLGPAVDVVVLSSEHGKRKPDPTIFHVALDGLGVAPEQAVFVGDRLAADIAGAHDVGMTTVQATWFRNEEQGDRVRPDYVAREPLEILEIIDRCLAATPS